MIRAKRKVCHFLARSWMITNFAVCFSLSQQCGSLVLISFLTCTFDSTQCCSVSVSTIWSVINILKVTAGTLFKMLSDAPAFTDVLLQHTRTALIFLPLFHLYKWCDLSQLWHYVFYLLAMFCCQCHSYIWTDQCGFLQALLCQFWEVCQPAYSVRAFTARDKTEMTRQSPFCQHCHGGTGMAVYPKVNGMTSGTESARLRETCACFT